MQTLRNGYRGLSLLIDLNRDILVSAFALAVALAIGAWLLSGAGHPPLVPSTI